MSQCLLCLNGEGMDYITIGFIIKKGLWRLGVTDPRAVFITHLDEKEWGIIRVRLSEAAAAALVQSKMLMNSG